MKLFILIFSRANSSPMYHILCHILSHRIPNAWFPYQKNFLTWTIFLTSTNFQLQVLFLWFTCVEMVQKARVKFSYLNDHYCIFMPLDFFISSVKKWQAKLRCSIIIQLTLAREVVFITRLIYVNNVLVVVMKDCRACRLLTPFTSLDEQWWAMMICSNSTFISKIYHLYYQQLMSSFLFRLDMLY